MIVTAEELFEKIKEIPEDLRRCVKIAITSEYHCNYTDLDGIMEIDDLKVTNNHIILESSSVNQEIDNLQNQIDDI